MTRAPSHDVVVAGDGPAARALGAACVERGLDVVLVGPDDAWTSTFGAWVDEVDHRDAFAAEFPIDVVSLTRRRLDRRYGVFHNQRLRRALDRAPRLTSTVTAVQHHMWGAAIDTADGTRLTARLVVDATGAGVVSARRPDRGTGHQTAYGLVLPVRPDVGGDGAVLMDWRASGGAGKRSAAEPTFVYLVQLEAGRWLVEETSLARRSPMPIDELRARLAARLGADLTGRAEHVEHVSIPMRPGVPSRLQPTVGFGAAAGFVHPATGYSVTASLRAAPRVAAAIAGALDGDVPAAEASRRVWDAVWPPPARRARALHDQGLAALLRLGGDDIRQFFESFFELPVEVWAPYLRVDVGAAEVSRAMSAVFARVPWPVRTRLAAGSPVAFARLLR
ncbi:MAG: lycopene cyclase family protein [Acidimicrobiales bacterium]|nr:lycopene cyclase family protein [Acidimicrobiales bacterium]MCB9394324.1 lycopene cyclase family protein [Acidimicrobiaceae bacterium]